MSLSKSQRTIIAAFIIIAITAIVLYIEKPKVQKSFNQQTKQSTKTEKDQNTIDCSQKIAQDKGSQLSQSSNSKTNCLFLGCGDFF